MNPPTSHLSTTTPTKHKDATIVDNKMHDTPSTDMTDQEHRRMFLEAAFRKKDKALNSTNTTDQGDTSMFSVAEYNEHLRILRYWNMTEGHVDESSGNRITMNELRRSVSKSWYKKEKLFRINSRTMIDGVNIEVLERIDPTTQSWKQVVHEDNVFDAIKECHGQKEHRNIKNTKDLADKHFWNITEQLCRTFVQTCPRCNPTSQPKLATPKKISKESISPETYFNKYEISVIDISTNPQKDMLGTELIRILLVYDNTKDWVILRPINTMDSMTIHDEILSIICAAGYPPDVFDKQQVISAVATLASNGIKRNEKWITNNEFTFNISMIENLEQRVVNAIQTLATTNDTEKYTWTSILNHISIDINSTTKKKRRLSIKRKQNITKGHKQSTGDNIQQSTSMLENKNHKTTTRTHIANEDSTERFDTNPNELTTTVETENESVKENTNDWYCEETKVQDISHREPQPIPRELQVLTTEERGTASTLNSPSTGLFLPVQQQSTTVIDVQKQNNQEDRSIPLKSVPLKENFVPEPPKHSEIVASTTVTNAKPSIEGIELFPISQVPETRQETETEMSILTYTQDEEVSNNRENDNDDQIETIPTTQNTLAKIDEMIEDKELAAEIKAAYQFKEFDIRFFFRQDQIKGERDTNGRVVFPTSNAIINHHEIPKLFRRMNVKEAFKLGKTTTRYIGDIEYRLCHPKLICSTCDEYAPSRTITIAEDEYYERYKNENNRWFYADMVSTFGVLCSHDAHRSDVIYIDATLPSIPVRDNTKVKKIAPLPPSVNTIVSVIYNMSHFAIMRLSLENKHAYFYDGLSRSIEGWKLHMNHILNQYGYRNQDWKMIPGPTKNELDGITIKQEDQSSCGPIACMILWKLFKPDNLDLRQIPMINYREIVITELQRLLEAHDSFCVLHTRKRRKNSEEDSFTTSLSATTQQTENHPTPTENNEPDDITKTSPPHEKLMGPDKSTISNKTKKNRKTQDSTSERHDTSPITDYFPKKTITTKNTEQKETTIPIPKKQQKETPIGKQVTTKQNMTRRTSTRKRNVLVDSPSSESDSSKTPEEKTPKEKGDSALPNSNVPPTTKGKEGTATTDSTEQNAATHHTQAPERAYDGLWDSSEEEEDEAFMEKVTPSHLKKINQKPQESTTPVTKKPRIKISISKGSIKPIKQKRCGCKKGCDKRCGCRRSNHKCNITCACKGQCSNS
jgi:hypothetical protein